MRNVTPRISIKSLVPFTANIYRTVLELAESNADDDATITQIMDWRLCTRHAAKELLMSAREHSEALK